MPKIAENDSTNTPKGDPSEEFTPSTRAQQILDNPESIRGTELRVMMNLSLSFRQSVRQIIDVGPWTKEHREVLESFFSDESIGDLPAVSSYSKGKTIGYMTLLSKYNRVSAIIVDRMLASATTQIPLPSQHNFSIDVEPDHVLSLLEKKLGNLMRPPCGSY